MPLYTDVRPCGAQGVADPRMQRSSRALFDLLQ
jgi:hypothetical protein